SASHPAPSVRLIRSPGCSLRTRAACRPSGPSRRIRTPSSFSGATRKTGTEVIRLPASSVVDGVLDPGEQALLARGEGAGRPLLAAQAGELAHQLLLLHVEVLRRLHLDVHHQ